jgi:hypothetical protein
MVDFDVVVVAASHDPFAIQERTRVGERASVRRWHEVVVFTVHDKDGRAHLFDQIDVGKDVEPPRGVDVGAQHAQRGHQRAVQHDAGEPRVRRCQRHRWRRSKRLAVRDDTFCAHAVRRLQPFERGRNVAQQILCRRVALRPPVARVVVRAQVDAEARAQIDEVRPGVAHVRRVAVREEERVPRTLVANKHDGDAVPAPRLQQRVVEIARRERVTALARRRVDDEPHAVVLASRVGVARRFHDVRRRRRKEQEVPCYFVAAAQARDAAKGAEEARRHCVAQDRVQGFSTGSAGSRARESPFR